MNILFFVRHFFERGTEVAIYDYAKYNEEILNNKSYIICFSNKKQKEIGFPTERISYEKFQNRFQIIEIDDFKDITNIIEKFNISFFYTLTHGGGNDIYQFENKQLWGKCKTIKHCVFHTTHPEGDYYIGISDFLNIKYKTCCTIIPHIVTLPICDSNLRKELNIPDDSIVFGRYGGYEQFDIRIAHEAIKEFLQTNTNTWFLFMNTRIFFEHPHIIYLDKSTDLIYKTKFINTCDAMIHARSEGETFGLSIAEFSIKNKPIITCPCGDLEHIQIMGEKAIQYRSKEDLLNILRNIESIRLSRNDWNAYTLYTPEYIMGLFQKYIFSRF